MKKIIATIILILVFCVNVHAETIESFQCTPKKTSKKHQAKNNFNFTLVSTNSEKQKFVTYNIKDNVAMAWFYPEKFLIENMGVKGYKSYSEWTTTEYNFWNYYPDEPYTVTNYIMTERKKDGKLLLAATIVVIPKVMHEKFSELEKIRNEHKDNKEKYFTIFKKDTSELYQKFETEWQRVLNRGIEYSKAALIAWDCKKI